MSTDNAISSQAGTSGGAGDPGHDHVTSDGIGRARSSGGDNGASNVLVIPPEIVKAICKVQSGMQAVKRDGKNQHGNYAFASTDAVYAALALKLAEVGLAILCLEEEVPEIRRTESNGKTVQWGRFVFSFILATDQATWSDPRWRRTLYLQITGPQSFMAAQSYAEKALLRSLFKIATGDIDLDAMPQAETEEAQEALVGNGRKRKSSSAAKKDGTTETFNGLRAAISSAPSLDDLIALKNENAEAIAEMPERWASLIDDEFIAKSDELRARMT